MSNTYNPPTSLSGIVHPPLEVDLSWIAATPIGSVTGPSLLLHMDGTNGSTTFLDSSGYSVPVTGSAGPPTISTTAPEFGTGCGHFPGVTANVLSFPGAPSSNLDLSTTDWTIECWVKTIKQGQQIIYSCSNFSNFNLGGFRIYINGNSGSPGTNPAGVLTLQAFGTHGGTISQQALHNIMDGAWHACAIVKTSSHLMFFLDGTMTDSLTMSIGNSTPGNFAAITTPQTIGADGGSALQGTQFVGSLDEFRITQAALYSGNYTPAGPFPNPTSPVAMLLHMDGTNGSTIFTDSSLNTLPMTAVGGAIVETSQVKFGTGALLGNNSNAALSTPLIASGPIDFYSSNTDFTWECWFYNNALGFQGLMDFTGVIFGNGYRITMSEVSGGSLTVKRFGGTTVQLTHPNIAGFGVWHHVALVRHGSALNLYLDGISDGLGTTLLNNGTQSAGTALIGVLVNNSGFWNGFIDEVRLSMFAVYTASFTPPTAPFPQPTPQTPPPGYDVYRNGVPIAQFLGGPTFSDTVPSIGTYAYTVAAWDGTADISVQSSPLNITFSASIPTVNLSAKFAPSLDFKALMLANPGDINPRVYPPRVDTTAKLIPRTIV